MSGIVGEGVNRRGFGKVGYCKLCAWEHALELNRKIRDGTIKNAAQAQEFALRYGLTFNRQTFYNHKPHALGTEGAVVQAASQAMKKLQVKNSSNDEFLGAIRNIGMARAIQNPEDVSIDHALKAASILEARKDKAGDQINLLVAIVTGNAPAVQITPGDTTIEGEAREIS
jgi:hypothetical protein